MKNSQLFIAISITLSGLFIAGCDKADNESAAAEQKMPPAVVNVMPVKFQSVPLVQEFSGRTTAYEVADIRPQVTGIIEEIKFQQGFRVQKGQPLYQLSPENYLSNEQANKAALQQAYANLQTAEANYQSALANIPAQEALLSQARSDVNRLEPLRSQQAISEQRYEQALTQMKTAEAAVNSARAAANQAQAGINGAKAAIAAAEAQLSSSQLDMSRTIIRAPISGIAERSNVTAGALVNANQTQPLVTISKINPIYVDISQSSAEVLKLRQQQMNGELELGINSVELVLEDGSTYPTRGQLSLTEAKVDKDTGAITLRAVFNNDSFTLLPGMYVQARLTQGIINNAVLVPQSALMRTPKGETQVYIVDKDDKIQIRNVTVKGTYQGKWIVTDGLKQDEKLVVIGGSKVKPEQKVVSKPYQQTAKANNTPAKASAPQSPTTTASKGTPKPATETNN